MGLKWTLAVLMFFVSPVPGSALAQTDSQTATQSPKIKQMKGRAIQFLEVTQSPDGSWTNPDSVGITGLVTSALLRSGKPVDDPMVAKGLKFLLSHQQSTGGIHALASRHQNYETCIALLALAEANQDGRYTESIEKAESFLRGLQWDEGEGIESSDGAYGGGGYDSKQRPDMSNTQFLIEALKKAGVAEDDPAMQKAVVFVSRAQNLESVHNSLPYAGKVNDGGFIYTPAKGGESKAGATENGGHKSYGSITYAGLKSLIFAGLKQDDPRIQAAKGWIRSNYTLRENPGMGQQGLFYYFHTFSKTMSVLEIDRFEDAAGQQHDWRAELVERLGELQQENGSWVNPADRWYEGDPNLVTAYCLIALSYCDGH
ncbi:MAG: terpene cyclase/mutase family protein [Planctomyces sp.]|nr:terpene cyclase/mutase family protein [Planctomyces sp.]